jgi:hypothetical protein
MYRDAGPKNAGLWYMPLDDRKPIPFRTQLGNETNGGFSPDGHWVAYELNESGTPQVYVAPFPPGPGGKQMISRDFSRFPKWSADGKEIYYMGAPNKLMAVSVTATNTEFHVQQPVALFETPYNLGTRGFQVSSDGKRFLVGAPVEQDAAQPLTVELNWQASLTK